jgi:hypothetical protein
MITKYFVNIGKEFSIAVFESDVCVELYPFKHNLMINKFGKI